MSELGRWHLDNWTDDDFRKHIPAVRTTLKAAFATQDRAARAPDRDVLVEALRKIEEAGTVESVVRVGDMYAKDGYETYINRTEAAEIARAALSAIEATTEESRNAE